MSKKPDEDYDYPAFLQDAMGDDNDVSNNGLNDNITPNFYGCLMVVVAIVIGFMVFAI